MLYKNITWNVKINIATIRSTSPSIQEYSSIYSRSPKEAEPVNLQMTKGWKREVWNIRG